MNAHPPVSCDQIRRFRLQTNGLDARRLISDESLRTALWAGQQDSVPRAALLSLHARLDAVPPFVLDHPAVAQVWGPRYTAYAIPEPDQAVFTLSRWPDNRAGRERAATVARQLRDHLDGARRPYDEVGTELGVPPNRLRYATVTGTVRIGWDGAHRSLVWCVPEPATSPAEARAQLARRYLHCLGPATSAEFAQWAGIATRAAAATFSELDGELRAVDTPIGAAFVLGTDVEAITGAADDPPAAADVRLLPAGDTFTLLWGAARDVLVADPSRRDSLWTPRVWPGAVLAGGEVRGTWRRKENLVTVELWEPPSDAVREAIEREAGSLPLPELADPITVDWL